LKKSLKPLKLNKGQRKLLKNFKNKMNVFEAIKNRRSVRAYKSDPVPEKKLNKVLEAARLAPSAHNAQEWKLMVVRKEETRKRLAKAALGQDFVGKAPVVIVAVALNPESKWAAIDLAIAIDHMTIQAVEEDLGTCWIGAFSQEEVKEILEIPEKYKVIALLPLGFPADKPVPKTRKDISEIVSYEHFK